MVKRLLVQCLKKSWRMVCCGLFLWGAWSGSQAQQLHMVSDSWAPMTGEKLQQSGFSIDLARQVFNELGYTLTLEFKPWDQIMSSMDSGDYQVISAVWYTQQRNQYLHFSEAYEHNKMVFISRKSDSFLYSGVSSLAGKTLGLVKSYAYPQTVLKAPDVKFKFSQDAKTNLQLLAAGQVHLTLGNYLVMKFEATRHVHPAHKLFYDTQHALQDIPLHMAVSRKLKNHEALVKGINRVLMEFKKNGRYQLLQKQHGLN